MIKIFLAVFTTFLFLCPSIQAQTEIPIYAANTTKEARAKEYKYLINSINKDLSLALTDSTEDHWTNAFGAMELLNYRTVFIDGRVSIAMDSVEKRSIGFQRSLLEMVYSLYPKDYNSKIISLANKTSDAKLFAMCCEYLLMNNQKAKSKDLLLKNKARVFNGKSEDPFFTVLQNKLLFKPTPKPHLYHLLSRNLFTQ